MDELLNRQMPQSIEAEQAVLGAMLIDPASVPVVVELLKPEDFYAPENRKIFETIYAMFASTQKIDAVTVLDELKTQGEYDAVGGRAYFFQLMDVTPTAANVREYCEIVRGKRILRELVQISAEISEAAYTGGDASEVVELAESKIYAVRQDREVSGLAHIRQVLLDVYEELDERAKRKGQLAGLPTGFTELDYVLTGLNKSDLILIASRPAMGKTSFALNIALSAAKASKKSVAVFQLEMSREQLVSRLVSSEALVDSRKMRMGELTEDDWLQISRATNLLAKTNILIDDNPSVTVAEIKAKCRRLGEDLGLVVIDYLQLMHSGKKTENRVQEVSEISRSLKIMAKELNVPVVCLSQLSRAAKDRTDKRPIMSDLRESGSIEQDADIILMLYRDDYYHPDTEEKNVAEVIISKNRHGSTGTCKLQWIGQFTTFANQEKQFS